MWDPIGKIQEMLTQIANDLANACFDWLKVFMVGPTDFSNYPFIHELFSYVSSISVTLGISLFCFNLLKLLVQQMGGYARRSVSEVSIKSFLGTAVGCLSPFILNGVLIKINNAWVSMMLSKGVTIGAIQSFMAVADGGITSAILGLSIAITFVILTIQYAIRLAKLLILYVKGPLCAVTMVNEDFNVWGVWYKDAVATVFTQSYHVTILWIIINIIGAGRSVKDLLLILGLMIVLIMPGLLGLGKYMFSTGAARSSMGAAGGAAKMGLLKFMGKGLIK